MIRTHTHTLTIKHFETPGGDFCRINHYAYLYLLFNKYAKPTVAVAVAANSKLFESANLLLMFDHIPLSPQSPSASSISLLLLLLLLLLLPKGVLQFGQVVLPCPSFQRFKHLL